MKKVTSLLTLLLLGGFVSSWAQSATGTAQGQRGASPAPADNGSKASNSQLEGKGVPYGKEKQQQQSRSKAGQPDYTGNPASGTGQRARPAKKATAKSAGSTSSNQ
ncbi:hypothetical protein [Spirosoma koreense]